jgi:Rrf2 family protein
MKLNKKQQYALLLVLYLCRSGRTSATSMSEGLGISKFFADQILRALRKGGVVTSVKGPSGGHELTGDPAVGEVLRAMGAPEFMANSDLTQYRFGGHEHRALAALVSNMRSAVSKVLTRKVRSIGQELVANELAMMDKQYCGQLEGGN